MSVLELTAKQYRIELMEKLINEVKQLPSKPKIFIIKANNDESSSKYVSNKLSDAMAVGADASLQVFDKTCKTEEIIKFIKKLNNDKSVNGIIVQQPMYAHLDVEKIINSVSLQKDIDGLCVNTPYKALTPMGVIELLKYYDISLEGKDVCIIGRGKTSGEPMVKLCLEENATVTICHSKTKNLEKHLKNNEIIICCANKPEFIKPEMINEGTVLVNVGMALNGEGKLKGNYNYQEMAESGKVVAITPIFNSTGLMTRMMMVKSLINAYKIQNKIF